MTVVSKGFDAYVPVDACGTFSKTKQQARFCEWSNEAMGMDWAKLVGQIAHAYGK